MLAQDSIAFPTAMSFRPTPEQRRFANRWLHVSRVDPGVEAGVSLLFIQDVQLTVFNVTTKIERHWN